MDPAARDNEALRWACCYGHPDVVKRLLALPRERGVDPAAADNAATRWARANGHTEVVKLLLAHAASELLVRPAGDAVWQQWPPRC